MKYEPAIQACASRIISHFPQYDTIAFHFSGIGPVFCIAVTVVVYGHSCRSGIGIGRARTTYGRQTSNSSLPQLKGLLSYLHTYLPAVIFTSLVYS